MSVLNHTSAGTKMTVATTLVNGPILVSQLQFRGLNRFSTFKLDICGKFKFKKSISHCTLIPPKMTDSVENRAAAPAGDEGVSFGGLQQEALIDGSINFSSDGVKAILNSLSKWLMAAVFGIILLWRHDMEVLWATSGGVVNACLSTALKGILNHERPVSTLRSDPGMPSSHAQSIFYTVAFCIILMIKFFGFNEITAVISALIFAMGSYFSKWLVVVVFGIMFLWRHDIETLWAICGVVVNARLSTVLKGILNHERPVITLRSDPGMPSSHAQSIFYTVAFCIISMVEYFGCNGITAVTSVFIIAMGSYFSWLRVSQRFHTLNQVAVGAVLGFCFSVFWFWLWDALLNKAFIAHFWVRIVAVVGAAGSCVGFLLYVVWNWVHDNKH